MARRSVEDVHVPSSSALSERALDVAEQHGVPGCFAKLDAHRRTDAANAHALGLR
jgi:hypothetical protein